MRPWKRELRRRRRDARRALRIDYRSYLRSALWRGLRAKVMGARGWTCERCARPADLVHHKDYGPDVMMGLNDWMDHLEVLCRGCHDAEHGFADAPPPLPPSAYLFGLAG